MKDDDGSDGDKKMTSLLIVLSLAPFGTVTSKTHTVHMSVMEGTTNSCL